MRSGKFLALRFSHFRVALLNQALHLVSSINLKFQLSDARIRSGELRTQRPHFVGWLGYRPRIGAHTSP
jgi:hypothetical protein